MSPAYLIAALGSVFYGSGDLLGGLAARRADAWTVTFVVALSALVVLLVGIPLAPGVARSADMAWGAVAGVCGAFGALLIFKALAIGPFSVASPVLGVVGLSLPVLVGIVLGERPGPVAIVGLVLAPVSIVLLAQGGHGLGPAERERVRRVLWPSVAAGLVAGTFLVSFAQIRTGSGLWPLLLARIVSIVVLGGALVLRRAPLVPPRGARALAITAGALDSLANVAYVAAVQRGSLSLVATIVSLAPATTVLLARSLLGERWSVPQRFGLAAALAAGACISSG